jgi:hypothetical protein
MGLNEEIKSRRAEVHSDGYPMSIGELINLYRDNELDIHPEFQRYFRWSDEQKSKLIESILLGIPIPSIFVSQREDGVWDVIDGQQRLSTIFQLVGSLRGADGQLVEPLVLKKTKYLPSLEGKRWEDDNSELAIGTENQLIIKRSKIDVKIILRESSESTKYELFQLINTGGSQLSEQELRNVILIMVKPEAYRWIRDLANDSNFRNCTALTDRALYEQYDAELVVRFLVFRWLERNKLKDIGDIGDFLTDTIVELAQSDQFNSFRAEAEESFRFTFERLSETLNSDSFHKYDASRERHSGGFLISAFEVIAIGLGYNAKKYIDGGSLPDIQSISKNLWQIEEFTKNSGTGVRASSRIPVTIPLGRRLFE